MPACLSTAGRGRGDAAWWIVQRRSGAITGGAVSRLKPELPMTPLEEALVQGALFFGMGLGCLVGAELAEELGRRRATFASETIVFLLWWVAGAGGFGARAHRVACVARHRPGRLLPNQTALHLGDRESPAVRALAWPVLLCITRADCWWPSWWMSGCQRSQGLGELKWPRRRCCRPACLRALCSCFCRIRRTAAPPRAAAGSKLGRGRRGNNGSLNGDSGAERADARRRSLS